MRLFRGQQGLPLAIWASGLAGASALGVLVVVAAGLGVAGRLDQTAWLILGVGLLLCGLATWAAHRAGRRFATAVRRLRENATRRMEDPDAPLVGDAKDRMIVTAIPELLELARSLEALHLRIRVADDVAERHRHMAETTSAGMFELLSGLVEAEESARGQLSAELHDTVAQTLMLARSRLAAPTIDAAELAAVRDLVAEAEDQVRAVMARTRPPALREGDLAQAVLALRDDLRTRYGLEVLIEWPSSPYPLPLVTAVTVYRFFQEALLNVVKHADVDVARISLTVDESSVVAVVRDDGPGFDPEQVRPERGRHVGLGLLRERVRLAGGSLEIRSWPNAGTTLTLRMPRGAPTGPLVSRPQGRPQLSPT
ncbi:MAG: sensor histidine kinase [Acidothermus sp.]|nr:sensor histidine kinase [Acidothermus sp.]MCL6537131.1 sensor histidine kinase [Acidothermus sp.]